MPSLELLLPFLAATFVFAVMPGPAILYTAAQTLARGRRGGFMAAAGIHLGGGVHVIAAAAGLSAVFRHVPEAYLAVKLLGALYLIWLGFTMLRNASDRDALPKVRDKNAKRAFVESMAVEILNPKAALFYIAFLPQFVEAGAALPLWAQFLILGWIVNLAFSLADVATILLTSAMLARVRQSGLGERLFRWAGGGLLVGLGLHLAIVRD